LLSSNVGPGMVPTRVYLLDNLYLKSCYLTCSTAKKLESLYSSLIDEKEILQCFLNLPCCLLNNEKEKRPKKRRKYSADTHLLACNGNNHFCDSNADHCYLNLPEDMVEDKPLDLEKSRRNKMKTMIFNSH
jgi:hypothetical protein